MNNFVLNGLDPELVQVYQLLKNYSDLVHGNQVFDNIVPSIQPNGVRTFNKISPYTDNPEYSAQVIGQLQRVMSLCRQEYKYIREAYGALEHQPMPETKEWWDDTMGKISDIQHDDLYKLPPEKLNMLRADMMAEWTRFAPNYINVLDSMLEEYSMNFFDQPEKSGSLVAKFSVAEKKLREEQRMKNFTNPHTYDM